MIGYCIVTEENFNLNKYEENIYYNLGEPERQSSVAMVTTKTVWHRNVAGE